MSDERLPDEGEELTDDFDFEEEDPGEIEAAEETDSPEEIEDNRRQEDENARLRAENERLKAAMQQPQMTYQQQMQASLAALEQFEGLSYEQKQQLVAQNIQRQALMQADQADRAHFRKLMSEQRYPARYATRVEEILQSERARGMNYPREAVLNFVLGEEVRNRRTGGPAASATGVRPAARGRTRQDVEDERLLRGVTLGEASRGGGW